MTIGNLNNLSECISGLYQDNLYKDWQLNITSIQRANLVENIVKSILPNYNLNNLNNKCRLATLLQYSHKIEQEMFYNSDSKEEYLYLISKKIEYIRQEFLERRLLRKIDNLTNSNNLNNWKQEFNNENREAIIKKILQILIPKVMIYDLRFLNLIKYVQRIEKYCYLKAQNKDNYYQLLAERSHKILIDLNRKKIRKHQENQQEEKINLVNQNNNLVINSNEMNSNSIQMNNNVQLNSINQLPKTDDLNIKHLKSLTKININSIKRIFETQILNQSAN